MSMYMLIMHNSPILWALPEQDRNEIMSGHGAFMEKIKETGEFVATHALAEPTRSSVVSVSSGEMAVREGTFMDTKEFIGGYYLVECKSDARAHEVASMIPDAKIEGLGIEVRPIMFSAGASL